MNGLGHWAEWDGWAGAHEEFCYKFCGHPAHAQVLSQNGLSGSVHNVKIMLYFPDGYVYVCHYERPNFHAQFLVFGC